MPALKFLCLRSAHSCLMQRFQKTVATVCILGLLSAGATAQKEQSAQQDSQLNQPSAPQASSPPGTPATAAPGTSLPPPNPQPEYEPPLRESTRPYPILGIWKPYMPHLLPEPVLKNSDRL